MRVFKSKGFVKFASRQNIGDEKLCEAVADADQGQIDADYGGGVIKQRVSRPGEGKSGGFRVIVCFRQAQRAFFVYGFAKSDKANLDRDEVKMYKQLARVLFALSDEELENVLKTKELWEVQCDGKAG